MLVILSGISGSGKNTVISRLIKAKKNRYIIKSATTRARRNEDDEYEYLSDEEFERRKANGEFFESISVHSHKSATTFKELQKVIDNPQNDYFKDIEVIGTQKLVEYLKGKVKTLTIFLDVPYDELRKRLQARGESEDKIKLRLSRGEMEKQYMDKYDLVIQNDDLEKTLKIIENAIDKM